MTSKKNSTVFWFAFGLVVVGLLLLAWSPVPTHAGPSLPARATPTPITKPKAVLPSSSADDDRSASAHIELHVPNAPAGAWAAVQWQDSAGVWHDVGGWRGTLDADGKRVWWVAAKDFGTGPFRWAISQGEGGELLDVSHLFDLPSMSGETVRVEVSLQP